MSEQKCGAVNKQNPSLVCDREPDHEGDHRAYYDAVDEVLFWNREFDPNDPLYPRDAVRQAYERGVDDGKKAALEGPRVVLADTLDKWLGNGEGLMIEDVIEWREKMALALGVPPR